MMKKTFPEQSVAITTLLSLVIAIILAVVLKYSFSSFKVLEYIGAISTLSIAFLTVAYVYVTSKQLDVMKNQLCEMTKSRELEAQPLPYLEILTLFFEKPKPFFSPSKSGCRALSRFRIKYKLSNQGTHPAVNIVVTSKIIMNTDGKIFELDGGANELNILDTNTKKAADSEADGFMFNDSDLTKLIRVIRDRRYQKPAILEVKLAYKNIIGGCFLTTCYYNLAPRGDMTFEVLANWESRLASFNIEFSERLEILEMLSPNDGLPT
jgi:hypothetical protein